MLLTVAGLVLLLLMAVAALPLPKVRQAVLTFAARAGLSGVLAAVAVCGTLFVRPDAVPASAAPYAQHLTAEVSRYLPEPAAALPGVPWLILAAVVVALALPLLSLLEFAARVMGHTAMMQAVRKELRTLTRALDRKLADLPDHAARASEVSAAAAAVRAVAEEPPLPLADRPKLVKDLL